MCESWTEKLTQMRHVELLRVRCRRIGTIDVWSWRRDLSFVGPCTAT